MFSSAFYSILKSRLQKACINYFMFVLKKYVHLFLHIQIHRCVRALLFVVCGGGGDGGGHCPNRTISMAAIKNRTHVRIC